MMLQPFTYFMNNFNRTLTPTIYGIPRTLKKGIYKWSVYYILYKNSKKSSMIETSHDLPMTDESMERLVCLHNHALGLIDG